MHLYMYVYVHITFVCVYCVCAYEILMDSSLQAKSDVEQPRILFPRVCVCIHTRSDMIPSGYDQEFP
jgi:hypothetical protein